jgi:hypothetical protein
VQACNIVRSPLDPEYIECPIIELIMFEVTPEHWGRESSIVEPRFPSKIIDHPNDEQLSLLIHKDTDFANHLQRRNSKADHCSHHTVVVASRAGFFGLPELLRLHRSETQGEQKRRGAVSHNLRLALIAGRETKQLHHFRRFRCARGTFTIKK